MTDETPTPLWKLPAKWRADVAQTPDTEADPEIIAYDTALDRCADELEAALAAFDVDAAAREVIEPYFRDAKNKQVVTQLENAIAAALRAAAAASWQTCRVTGKAHEWVGGEPDGYHGFTPTRCETCGIPKTALEAHDDNNV